VNDREERLYVDNSTFFAMLERGPHVFICTNCRQLVEPVGHAVIVMLNQYPQHRTACCQAYWQRVHLMLHIADIIERAKRPVFEIGETT
jgi:hypothetical protein